MIQVSVEEQLRRNEKGRQTKARNLKLLQERREINDEKEFRKFAKEYHPNTLGFTYVSREDLKYSYDDLHDKMFNSSGNGAITFYRDFDYELVDRGLGDPRNCPVIAPVVSDDYMYVIETGKIVGDRVFNGGDDIKRFFIAMAQNKKVSRLTYRFSFGGIGWDTNRVLIPGHYTIFTIL